MLTVTTPTGSWVGAKARWAITSETTSSSAPMAAEEAMPTPEPPVSRRASCGAASETKEIGPATAVTRAVSATPTTTSAARLRSGARPRACAASSPISSRAARRPSTASSGVSTSSASAVGPTCCQPTALRLPAPHTAAIIACWSSALRISHVLTEASMALTPMPTTISRKPCTPPRYASR
jgi:hypothetical protein